MKRVFFILYLYFLIQNALYTQAGEEVAALGKHIRALAPSLQAQAKTCTCTISSLYSQSNYSLENSIYHSKSWLQALQDIYFNKLKDGLIHYT